MRAIFHLPRTFDWTAGAKKACVWPARGRGLRQVGDGEEAERSGRAGSTFGLGGRAEARARQTKPEKVIPEAAAAGNKVAAVAPQQRANRAQLIKAIVKARSWLDDLVAGRVDGVDAPAARERKSSRNIRMMIQLAFLGPEIVEAAAYGRPPGSIGATEIVRDHSVAWAE